MAAVACFPATIGCHELPLSKATGKSDGGVHLHFPASALLSIVPAGVSIGPTHLHPFQPSLQLQLPLQCICKISKPNRESKVALGPFSFCFMAGGCRFQIIKCSSMDVGIRNPTGPEFSSVVVLCRCIQICGAGAVATRNRLGQDA